MNAAFEPRCIVKSPENKVHAVRADGHPLCGGGHVQNWQTDLATPNCAACLAILGRVSTTRVPVVEETAPGHHLSGVKIVHLGYSWKDKNFGELTASTVVFACDDQAAVNHFKSTHPHLVHVWAKEKEDK